MIALLLNSSISAAAPPMTALTFAPDGKSLLVGSQAGIEIRNWPDLKPTGKLATELAHVCDLAFAPDGKLLAAAGGDPGEAGTLELWSWPEAKLCHRISLHKDLICAVAWKDSSTCATASADQTVHLLDANTGKSKQLLEGHSRPVLAVQFLPGSGQLVTAGVDETLRTWKAESGKPDRVFSNHTRAVNGLAVRPQSDANALPVLVSVSDDRTVRLWQVTIGRMMRFVRLPSEPRAAVWSRDGSAIFVACKDGALRVIDPENAALTKTSQAIDGVAYCLALAPDGSVVVAGQRGQIKRIQLLDEKR